MAVVNSADKILFSYDKDTVVDIVPDKVVAFRGEEVIGAVSVGTVAESARQDITRPLQSPNFKQGQTGWRLNSNGILEANGAIIT